MVVGLNMEEAFAKKIREDARSDWRRPWGPEPLWAFSSLLEMRTVTAALDVGKTTRGQATLTFATAKEAQAAAGAVQDALVLFRLFVLSRGMLEIQRELEFSERPLELLVANQLLKNLESAVRAVKVSTKLATVHVSAEMSLDLGKIAAQAKEELKALDDDEAFQIARLRRQSAVNLKIIVLALHDYHDTYRALPPAAICDKNGRRLLSWRVAILPFIEQDALYREFKLDEPWDSAHNIKLLPKMPKVYAPVGIATKNPHSTFYKAFVGPGTTFELRPDANAMLGAKGLRLLDCVDGASNTIGVAEATYPVEWTRPVELEFGDKGVPQVGRTMFKDGFHGMMMDGSVFFFERRIDDRTLRAMITRAGGEFVDYYRFTRGR